MVGRRRRAITATCDLEHFRTASRAANGRSRNAVCPSPDVIRGHQRSSEVIRGHQWSSMVIRGHQWSSEVIRGHQKSASAPHLRSSEVIRGHQRSSEVIRGHQTSASASHRRHLPASAGRFSRPPPTNLHERKWHTTGQCCRAVWCSPGTVREQGSSGGHQRVIRGSSRVHQEFIKGSSMGHQWVLSAIRCNQCSSPARGDLRCPPNGPYVVGAPPPVPPPAPRRSLPQTPPQPPRPPRRIGAVPATGTHY